MLKDQKGIVTQIEEAKRAVKKKCWPWSPLGIQ